MLLNFILPEDHAYVITYLFAFFEILLLGYLACCFYSSGRSFRQWYPMIVLLPLLIWNFATGYSSEVLVLVMVNTLALTLLVILMLINLIYRRIHDEEMLELPADMDNSAEAQDCFRSHCITYPLTSRELEVVLLIRSGCIRNRQIAEVLFISERTVEVHLRNIYLKVGCEHSKLALIYKLNAEAGCF